VKKVSLLDALVCELDNCEGSPQVHFGEQSLGSGLALCRSGIGSRWH
jgi:hypothetical protein